MSTSATTDLLKLPALSIRQPWAWLIVHATHAPKRFENRDWQLSNPGRRFRGRFLIHAGKGMTRDEYAMAEVTAHEYGQPLPALEALERGGIIGLAEVVAWHDNAPRLPYAFGSGLELANVQALPFTPCLGALGFFKPKLLSAELRTFS